MDRTLCFENSNEISGSCQVPEKYHLVFGSLSRNATIPTGGRGFTDFTVSSNAKFEFEIKNVKIISSGMFTTRADSSYFKAERLEKSFNTIAFKILKPIEGPQEIQLDFWVKFIGKDQNEASSIVGAKIFIVVS